MSLEQVSWLSQSIASLAVVGSLIYLALQVRGAGRSQRASMQQGRADRTSKMALTLANPDLSRVWQRGMGGDPAITRDEFVQWMLLCRAMFLSAEDSFLQYKAGTLDQASFERFRAGGRGYMSHPGFRAAWKLSAAHCGKELRAFLDSEFMTTPIAPDMDLHADWQKIVQLEKAASRS